MKWHVKVQLKWKVFPIKQTVFLRNKTSSKSAKTLFNINKTFIKLSKFLFKTNVIGFFLLCVLKIFFNISRKILKNDQDSRYSGKRSKYGFISTTSFNTLTVHSMKAIIIVIFNSFTQVTTVEIPINCSDSLLRILWAFWGSTCLPLSLRWLSRNSFVYIVK